MTANRSRRIGKTLAAVNKELDAALAATPTAWWNNPTRPVRRDKVKPGMVVHSSHGYRLLITEVIDTAEYRGDDRHVGFVGHLHADPKCELRTERYPAGSTIPVEINPTCDHPMRNGPCQMNPGHRGRHSTQVFTCDGCGKRRRSYPAMKHEDAGWYCFMCVPPPFGIGPREW